MTATSFPLHHFRVSGAVPARKRAARQMQAATALPERGKTGRLDQELAQAAREPENPKPSSATEPEDRAAGWAARPTAGFPRPRTTSMDSGAVFSIRRGPGLAARVGAVLHFVPRLCPALAPGHLPGAGRARLARKCPLVAFEARRGHAFLAQALHQPPAATCLPANSAQLPAVSAALPW